MIRAEELTAIATTLRQRSQNQRRLLDEHFRSGGSLTVAEALNRFGIFALSQRCSEMRRDGLPIVRTPVKTAEGARIIRYSYAIQLELPCANG